MLTKQPSRLILQDEDRKIPVSSGLETKTAVSRSTSPVTVTHEQNLDLIKKAITPNI